MMATIICRRIARRVSVSPYFTSAFTVHQQNFKDTFICKQPVGQFLYTHHVKNSVPREYFKVVRYWSTNSSQNGNKDEKLSIFKRFKQLYRDYWYVLVPVHLVTSAAWFGGFYYMAKSGIDIVAIMESWNFSEKITNPLKDSSMGYLAVAYALYKIATPLRYTVTLGGSTVTINYLKKWGYIKPVPSREQLTKMYQDKKETIIFTMKDKKEELKQKKDLLKDRTDHLIEGMEKKIITKIKDSKDQFDVNNGDFFNIGKGLKQIKKESN